MQKVLFAAILVISFLSSTTLSRGATKISRHYSQPDSISTPVDSASAQPDEPFAWGDFTWLQGNSRLHKQVLDSKYFTGDMTMDMNYNFNFHHPIDHTNSGSTATFRSDELNVSYIEVGGDFHDPESGARARLMLQFGSRSTGVPRNDATPLRGQFDLYTALRYVTEGYVGMHLNSMHGVNIDVGIFKSYVGLMGYNNFENWNYQNSFTSDNTPWFFTGVRIQTFPTDRLKLEYWIINGWQTYGMFNSQPGLGVQTIYRPEESVSIMASAYTGWDTPNMPGRIRFHSDNSLLIRYRREPDSFISKAAFSITGDIGFESGSGVVPFGGDSVTPAQNFLSWMFYHRLWLGADEHVAWTFGGGQLHNPGRYLALLPTGAGVLTQNPGDEFDSWDFSTGFQYMPGEHITWGLEFVHRQASVPYFAGPGGVTSPNGWNAPFGDPKGFVADLVTSENRIIGSLIVRF
jgi:hypothetical protein